MRLVRILWIVGIPLLVSAEGPKGPPVRSAGKDAPTGVATVSAAAAQPAPAADAAVRGPWSAPIRSEAVAAETPPTSPHPLGPFDFDGEIAIFLHKRVGIWTISDVWMVLGAPLRRRTPMEDNGQKLTGQILAYSDPTQTYQALELDFSPRGTLRSLFVYPADLTWDDCRRLWGTSVRATEANKGRVFYSYLNRRLDVLVAPGGKVISLGLY